MISQRGLAAVLTSFFFALPATFRNPPPDPAVGVLTRAYEAHLNAMPAFAGLSVFDGECLSTDEEGKLGVRIGSVVLALSGNTSATLQRIRGGAHVDMASGWLFFSSPANSIVEVHAIETLLRPLKNQLTQARVQIYAPQVLQIAALRGDLAFSFRDESRIIPEGETYRIYLDAESETQKPAGTGVPTATSGKKIAIFILVGAVAGLTAWGIHELIESSNGPESPAKP
jgi:hypothetical protein